MLLTNQNGKQEANSGAIILETYIKWRMKMPKAKTQKTKELEELKKNLPEKFDARKFKGCKINADSNKSAIASTCKELGFAGNEEAILAYLQFKAKNKKASVGKKKSKKNMDAAVSDDKALLSKKHYRSLSSVKIGKLIELLSEIQKERKEKDVAELKAKKQQIEKELKELQAN